MLRACIERVQYAVGHGGFHAGNIRFINSPISDLRKEYEGEIDSFWYIYDCGSEQSRAFKNALTAYSLSSSRQTEILFVSHLHQDHINGIERLQAIAPAKTVLLPYLDMFERLIFILGDIELGNISFSALEYFEAPASWWLRRGAKQVVFLEADDGDAPQPGEPAVPDSPIDGDDGGDDETSLERKKPNARLARRLLKPRGAVPKSLSAADETTQDISDGAFLAGAGSSIQLEWRRDVSADWQVGDWILLPYVHPVGGTVGARFRTAIKKKLNIRSNNEEKLTKKLIDWLKSPDKTKDLLEIYGEHFARGHNTLSMSLYSGPYSSHRDNVDYTDKWQYYWWLCADAPIGYSASLEPVGWLATGDSALKQRVRLDPWLNFYRPHSPNVGVMTLPHHGSIHNFHEDILFDGLNVALATTVERRERVAGIGQTLAKVRARHVSAHVVDDKYEKTYRICCGRIMRR